LTFAQEKEAGTCASWGELTLTQAAMLPSDWKKTDTLDTETCSLQRVKECFFPRLL
jgi:hypothetical protein